MPVKHLKLKGKKEPIGSLLEGGKIYRLRKGGLLPTLLKSSGRHGGLCQAQTKILERF